MVVGRPTVVGRRRVPERRGHRLHAGPGGRAPFHRVATETRTGNVRFPEPGPGRRQETTLFRPRGHRVQ